MADAATLARRSRLRAMCDCGIGARERRCPGRHEIAREWDKFRHPINQLWCVERPRYIMTRVRPASAKRFTATPMVHDFDDLVTTKKNASIPASHYSSTPRLTCNPSRRARRRPVSCLLYTSDAADE